MSRNVQLLMDLMAVKIQHVQGEILSRLSRNNEPMQQTVQHRPYTKLRQDEHQRLIDGFIFIQLIFL
jgi:hypothetical protein